MKRIGILSDTHGDIPEGTSEFFAHCDQIWHAGDIGSAEVIDILNKIAPVRAVFGNIDGTEIRIRYPEFLLFECEDVRILLIHIGGYPGKYTAQVKALINKFNPLLVITGHSHILKVIYDKKSGHLHINPGAAGKNGMHKLKTMIRLQIDGKEIKDLEIREIPRR